MFGFRFGNSLLINHTQLRRWVFGENVRLAWADLPYKPVLESNIGASLG